MEPAEYKPFAPEAHDYVDGRLSAEAERDFERRLERDAGLKKQVESLKRSIELLATLPVLEPKAGFAERVIGRVREDELANRARKQIAAAPTPLWQHVVQVGLGAAAAALVLAVIGVPGMFSDETDKLSGSGGIPVARVAPTEEDLLPALADHNARFESLRRNVTHTRMSDPHLQRQLVAMEIQYSDLMRRNQWLADQVAELPASRRTLYQGYLAEIDLALIAVNNEVSESLSTGREMNGELVDAQLLRVRSPGTAIDKYVLSANTGDPAPLRDAEKMAKGELTEMMLYSLVRQADYRHDHESVIETANFYLTHFASGFFKDQANVAVIAAHLRIGRDDTAAAEFARRFGEYDEDVQPERLELVRGLLTDPEFERLTAARKASRD